MKTALLILICSTLVLTSCAQKNNGTQPVITNNHMSNETNDTTKVVKTEAEWKQILTPEQFYILREKGTERPFTGKLLHNEETGVYTCAACGNELFTSDMKFDSHCGWPSFDREIAGGKINTHVDTSHGMVRTEITCARCGGHLGHLFDDGPTQTGARYCVNSVSIDFKKK